MKSYLAVAISIWVILEPTLAAKLSLDVGTATKAMYSDLLKNVRDKVKDPKIRYGGTNIPVIAEPSKPAQHLLVDLKAAGGEIITIALNKENLYLDGYLDKIDGKFRAHFFRDAPADAKNNLFTEAEGTANRITMKYTGQYKDIEKHGGDRTKLGLGVKQLDKFIRLVYGKPLNAKNEAQLMLIIIQTIAEAARFKYIENFILLKFAAFNHYPDSITIELEKSWQKITKGIKNSRNGAISPELELRDARDKPCKVSKVSTIEKHMGLLKFEGKTLVNVYYDNAGIHNQKINECRW